MLNYLVTATPPTTNGDLHVGHISGPYLAGDAFTRYQRLQGAEVVYITSGDDNQSYVVTSAELSGESPAGLAARSNEAIRATLSAASISVDAYTVPDAGHVAYVRRFFSRLRSAGVFTPKTKPQWYCQQCRRYLFESYLKGNCPVCAMPTRGAICEACGHPNDNYNLRAARCARDAAHPLETRQVAGLYLELERFRVQLTEFRDKKSGPWRPHLEQLFDELLASRLPDFPITYVSEWGIKFPAETFSGSVVNVWAEMLPGLTRTSRVALGAELDDGESIWHRQGGCSLVQFLGYDNSFFFAFAHVALLSAMPGWLTPDGIITNEFYNLDYRKFSTSQNHLVWARDALKQTSADALRFYLSMTNPEEFEETYYPSEVDNLVEKTLREPLRRALRSYRVAAQGVPAASVSPASTGAGFGERLDWYYRLFESAYSMQTFSLRRAAHGIARFVSWLADRAESASGASGEATSELVCGLRALASFSCPIMPDMAGRLLCALNAAPTWRPTREMTRPTVIPDAVLP